MKNSIFFLIAVFLLIESSYVFTEEKETIVEKEVEIDAEQIEIPPVIQDYLEKEFSKLPPVERHFRLAQQYHSMGKLEDAIKELELAFKEDPDNVPCNCELGVIYIGKEDYDKAIAQLNKTLGYDQTYPKTHYALANAYARKPNPDVKLARKHLDEAVKLGYHPVPWFLQYMERLEGKVKIEGTTKGVEEK